MTTRRKIMHRVAMWHLHPSTLFSSEPKLPEALVMSAMMLLLLQQMMLLWMLLLMLLLMCVRQAATRWHVTKNSQEQPQTHIQGPPNGWVSYRKIQYGDGGRSNFHLPTPDGCLPRRLCRRERQEKPAESGKAAIKWKLVCGVMCLAYLINVCRDSGRGNTFSSSYLVNFILHEEITNQSEKSFFYRIKIKRFKSYNYIIAYSH